MDIACIDLEGVLIPELWPHIAERTGIAELALTTREEPDYARLVQRRIALLRYHGLRLRDVQRIVADAAPLPGAIGFIEALGATHRIVLVSDAFQDMILPLWDALGHPELRCHRFVCDAGGFIAGARYTRARGKHEVIEEFMAAGARTLAVGDAFNDLTMLRQATQGFLFRPSPETRQAARDLIVANCYDDILSAVIPAKASAALSLH